MSNKEKLKNKYERRIEKITNIIFNLEKKHGKHPLKKFTYYGGWDIGYYKGLLYAYEEILDDMNSY